MLHRNDIRIARDIAYGVEASTSAENYQQMRPGQSRSTDVKLDYSLRQYVSVLYKVHSLCLAFHGFCNLHSIYLPYSMARSSVS